MHAGSLTRDCQSLYTFLHADDEWIGVARCVWWCRCDALVCARSVSVDSAAMETIGVISMAAVLALGPGPKLRSGTYKPKKYVLISLNNAHSSFNFFDL